MKKVLIVDDEPFLREMVRDFLELEGFEVKEAAGGKEAYSLIAVDSFDCVITDMRMPNGDGFELAKKINSMTGRKPKIIFITGASDISDVHVSELQFENVIVSKPFVPDELVEIVKTTVGP